MTEKMIYTDEFRKEIEKTLNEEKATLLDENITDSMRCISIGWIEALEYVLHRIKYGEQDWLVRYYDHEGRHGDAGDYDSLEEAIVAFDEGVDRQPKLEWTLYHYYDYKPDGDGGWHEPTEKLLRYWNGHVLDHDEIGPDTLSYREGEE